MDEEYVQEHILTGGIVAPVADSFMAAYSHFARRSRVIPDTFLLVWLLLCWFLRVAVARSNATRSTISRHADAEL